MRRLLKSSEYRVRATLPTCKKFHEENSQSESEECAFGEELGTGKTS